MRDLFWGAYLKISQETEFHYIYFASSCSLYLKSIENELLGSFRALHLCPLIPFCSMFDSHVFPHIPFTSTINVALVQGISADTGCGSGANYPLSTPMIKVPNKTLSGSSQKLPYLQNSHCLVSIHKDFECQHDINDMTLCLMTSGSMRAWYVVTGRWHFHRWSPAIWHLPP